MRSYLIILFCTILISTVAYNQILSVIEKDSIEESMITLQKGTDIIDSRFREVENLIIQITMQDEVKHLLKMERPLANEEYYRLLEASSRISSFKGVNDFIDDIYIITKDSDVLISSTYITEQLPRFYEFFLKYNSLSYDEWHDKTFSSYKNKEIWPTDAITINTRTQKSLTYLQTLPLGLTNSQGEGVAMVHIDEQIMHSYLSSLDIVRAGWLYIIGDNGDVISVMGESEKNLETIDTEKLTSAGYIEETIGNEQVVIIQTQSSETGLTFIAGIPRTYFAQKANKIKKMFIGTLLIILIVGILSAIYLSYCYSKPLSRLFKSLQTENIEIKASKGYNFIQGTISKIIDDNEELKMKLDEQIPLVQTVFMERLLSGGFKNQEEVVNVLKNSKLMMEGDWYFVVLFSLKGYFNQDISEESIKELDISRVVIQQALEVEMKGSFYIHYIDENKIALIVSVNGDNKETCTKSTEVSIMSAVRKLYDQYNMRLSIGMGKIYSNIMDINYSYEQAEEVLEFKNFDIYNEIVKFQDIQQDDRGYFYPMGLEMRLLNLVKSGQEEDVMCILDTIYHKNFIDLHLSNHEVKQLVYEMIGTIQKIKFTTLKDNVEENKKINFILYQIEICHSMEVIYDKITTIYRTICRIENKKMDQETTQLARTIVEYVNKTCFDEDMCLYKVASNFNLTEKELSRFFKENIKVNFVFYVRDLRMHKAIDLLKENQLPVSEIAKEVGYSNKNTFYKAFKRTFGVSPKAYKDKL